MIKTESRRFRRIKCRVIVEAVGATVDLSEGGICVLMANPLSEETEVQLTFELPETEELVQCRGRVVRVSPSSIDTDLFEVGIQFLRIMACQKEALAEYVRSHDDARSWN